MAFIGNQPLSQAFVTDQFSGNGSTTAFTMSVSPANTASVLVAVSGVLQDPSTYSVSGTTLTFSGAPPTGTGNISVRYLGIPASGVTTTAYRTVTEFTATASQTTFTPPSYTAGFINVYRNGSLLGSADYTATNGTTVVLAVGATVGDLVVVESFYVSSVLNAIPATAGAVNSTYIATGAVGSTQIAADAVTATQIAAGAVGSSEIATGAVGATQLAATAALSNLYGLTYLPLFSGYRTAGNVSATNVVLHNVINVNTGSCYNSSTGRFTCPVAGNYEISIGGHVENTQPASIYVYKNGAAGQGEYTSGSAYGAASCTIVVACAANDYLQHYVTIGTFWGGDGSGLRMTVKLISV
jgi:hypothetical protein